MLDARHHKQLWALKDQSTGQPLLGCGSCLDRALCGGLHTTNGGTDALDCLSMCRCEDKDKCDYVCPNAPKRYVRRLREVGGFELDNVPVAPTVDLPHMPAFAPLVEGNVAGNRPIRDVDFVAVPLSMTVSYSGQRARSKTEREMQRAFGFAPTRGWIASGVERDSYVERMWRLPDPKRAFEGIRKAGVIFATSPNYSTFADSPRQDNMHAMKRIAWSWYHMVEAGIPTALHINGRTDHDFVRWAEFAKQQVNLRAVAFEFLTGAEPFEDGERYVRRLIEFAKACGHSDLLLVLRGGGNWVAALRPHFPRILMLDSGPYFKTVKRQRMVIEPTGRLGYRSNRTSSSSELRALLRHNVRYKTALYVRGLERPAQGELLLQPPVSAPAESQAHNETPQFDLWA